VKSNVSMTLTLVLALGIVSGCSPTPASPTAVAISTLPVPPEPTPTEEPVHLKVGALSYISFSPFYIALEEGYFAEQNLDVELEIFSTANAEVIPPLLQRQMDVGTSASSAQILNAIAQGGVLKLVADKGYVNPDATCVSDGWVARNVLLDAGELTDFASLRGKTVVGSQRTSFEYIFDEMLRRGGLTAADVPTVEIRDNPTRLEALKTGTVDAAYFGEPWITRAVNQSDAGIWVPYQDVAPGFPISMVVFGPSLLEDRPDVGVRFMAAYLKGVRQFMEGKTDRNVELVAEFTQLTPEELQQVCWNSFKLDGSVDTGILETLIQYNLDKGYTTAPLTVEQVWDPQFIEGAAALLGEQ